MEASGERKQIEEMDELEADPNVNLAYLDPDSYEWVSVSGTARICTDRQKIRELYQPDWKMWFGAVDRLRDGGPDDPRLALILVDAESVVFMEREKSKPRVLFELARAALTGERPEVGKTHQVSPGGSTDSGR